MLNEKKFRAIYADFLQSGLTIRDYCANQHINEATFFYWQNKLKEKLPPKRGFVPLVLEKGQPSKEEGFSPGATANNPIFCEINYPNGIRVKLSGLPDVQLVQSLLLLTQQ